MSAQIPESDWRRFKELHGKLLERYCSRVLEEVATVNRGGEGTAHDRYLKLYALLQNHDQQIARTFNDFRRSTAVMQLAIMRRLKLLTGEERMLFSEPTRTQVEMIASL